MASDPPMTFADWLRDCMTARGMTQAALARRADLSEACLSRIITGRRQPGLVACIRLARALNLAPTTVLVKAKLLREPIPIGQEEEEWLLLYHLMCPMDQAEMKAMIRVRLVYRG